MKKINFIILLSISLGISAKDLISLNEYISENDLKDLFVVEYISKRCSSSNLAVSRFIGEGNEGYDTAFDGYLGWFLRAQDLRSKSRPDQDPVVAMENVASSIVNMTNVIEEIMQDSQDIRGSIFEGNSIINDLTICKEIVNSADN